MPRVVLRPTRPVSSAADILLLSYPMESVARLFEERPSWKRILILRRKESPLRSLGGTGLRDSFFLLMLDRNLRGMSLLRKLLISTPL